MTVEVVMIMGPRFHCQPNRAAPAAAASTGILRIKVVPISRPLMGRDAADRQRPA